MIKLRTKFGDVDADVSYEEKVVHYVPKENGMDLMTADEEELDAYRSIMDAGRETYLELYSKDELDVADAKVLLKLLDKFYSYEMSHDVSADSGYVFSVIEQVKKISLVNPINW